MVLLRELQEIEWTVKDSYPQPIIEDLLNQVAGHANYTKLDLRDYGLG